MVVRINLYESYGRLRESLWFFNQPYKFVWYFWHFASVYKSIQSLIQIAPRALGDWPHQTIKQYAIVVVVLLCAQEEATLSFQVVTVTRTSRDGYFTKIGCLRKATRRLTNSICRGRPHNSARGVGSHHSLSIPSLSLLCRSHASLSASIWILIDTGYLTSTRETSLSQKGIHTSQCPRYLSPLQMLKSRHLARRDPTERRKTGKVPGK
jgi:hypothetical protein